MSISQNDIDDLFYDGIEGHAEYPSENVWHEVEAELERDSAGLYREKYRSVKNYAILLSLILMGVLIYEVANFRLRKGSQSVQHDPQAINNQPDLIKPGKDDGELKNGLQSRIAIITGRGNKPSLVSGMSPGEKQESESSRATGKSDSEDPVLDLYQNDVPQKTANLRVDAANTGAYAESNPGNTGNMPSLSFLSGVGNDRKKNIFNTLPLSVPGNLQLPVLNAVIKDQYKNRDNSRFSLSFHISPGFVWNSIKENKRHHRRGGNGGGGNNGGGRGGRGDSRHDYIRSEQNGLAYYGGLNLHYKFSKRLLGQAGLAYLRISTIINSKKIYAVSDNTGTVRYRLTSSSGYSYVVPQGISGLSAGDSVVVSRSGNTISYLGVPVAIGYRFLSARKFSLTAAAGGQVNILLKGTTTARFNTDYSTSANMRGLQPVYFSLLANVTGELALNEKLSVTLAPVGQFGLSNINRNSSVKTRPSYIGLSAGVKLKL